MNKKRTILITGGAKRIGRFLSNFFVDHGWKVAVHYHQSEKEAQDLKQHYPEQVEIFPANLNNEHECFELINTVKTKMGAIDILINNASVFEHDDITSATKESWDFHINLNLRAPFILSQSFFKNLPTNHKGCIINIIDQRVLNLTPHFMSYTISKAGLWCITQTMALAMAPFVRVNAIAPGFVLPSNKKHDEFSDEKILSLPLQTTVNPLEICKTALYIIEAESLTGQIIAVDAGQHMGWFFPKNNIK